MEISTNQAHALDTHYVDYQIEEVMGIGYRYQARERGQIIAFFGYADTHAEALSRLLAKCKEVA